MDSSIFLKQIMTIIKKDGFSVVNIDATIVAEEPRISKHAAKIEKSLSKIMQLNIDQINVKSKSNDKLGYIGRNEGIESYVTLLIEKI